MRAGRVVGEQRRHFERHPAVDAVGPLVDWTEQIGGARQVFERELEEQLLAGLALRELVGDRGVVGRRCS